MSELSSQNTAMVTARNISFIADGQLLLDDISLSIASGTVTMVLGHNGAGKTLLLSALHGLIMPQRGTVTGPARQKQKMVFQKPVLLRRSARDYFEFLCPGLDDNLSIQNDIAPDLASHCVANTDLLFLADYLFLGLHVESGAVGHTNGFLCGDGRSSEEYG